MSFYIPTNIFFGEDCLKLHSDYIKTFGNKALIVTGRHSSKKNGSLNDILSILQSINVKSIIYDKIEENPSVGTVFDAATMVKEENIDYIIAIGGGSPLDAAKAIGIIIKHPKCTYQDLFENKELTSIPIIAIPTTAGTGSEVTPYAVLTDHKICNKRTIAPKIFPKVTFLDVRYFINIPKDITISTALDTLSHLIESFLCETSNPFSECFVEQGLRLWSECKKGLVSDNITKKEREKLLMASTFGGMTITETGTSLPHGMGYPLTYYHGIAHGKATAVFLPSFLKHYKNQEKVEFILKTLNINDVDNFEKFIKELAGSVSIKKDLIEKYSQKIYENKKKLRNHPYDISKEEIIIMYEESLNI